MASQAQTFDQFHYFPKCPVEIRLAIWASASPEPAVVKQQQTPHGLKYLRKIPAVLHACRESRTEYLELDDDTEDATKQRRAREHPIYKLSFRTRGMRGPATFFCNEIDSFWGTEFNFGGGWRPGSSFLLLKKLDISSTVKHMVLHVNRFHQAHTYKEFCIVFPKCETLTLVIDSYQYGYAAAADDGSQTVVKTSFVLPPEVDGQLDITSLGTTELAYATSAMTQGSVPFEQAKVNYPSIRFPEVKYRWFDQIIANEGIVIAQPKPQEEVEDDDPKPPNPVPVVPKRRGKSKKGKGEEKEGTKPVPARRKVKLLADEDRAWGSRSEKRRRRR